MRRMRIYTLALLVSMLPLAACSKDPEEFQREAVLVRTCPPIPDAPNGAPIKVYRFQKELWFHDSGGVLRRIDAQPDNACDVLEPKNSSK